MRMSPALSSPHAIARRDPAIELIPVAKLRPDPRNARTHSRRQVRQLAASIREFGFTSPVLIDENQRIIAGHGRVEAARLVGLKTVPCVCLAGLSETQKRAYMIADNKLALNAGWDEFLLREECQSLIELEPDFDISLTGFSPAEIDTLLGGIAPEEAGDPRDDETPAPPHPHPTRDRGLRT